jgi:hypothetical protein
MGMRENHIIAHMVDSDYPHGILVSPLKVKYCHMGNTRDYENSSFIKHQGNYKTFRMTLSFRNLKPS